MEGLLNKAPIGFEAESASVINPQNKYQLSLRAAVMDEPFMSPILGIVRVKFLSGRRTDGRATSFVPSLLASLLQSVCHSARSPHFTSRIGQHSVVRRTRTERRQQQRTTRF